MLFILLQPIIMIYYLYDNEEINQSIPQGSDEYDTNQSHDHSWLQKILYIQIWSLKIIYN